MRILNWTFLTRHRISILSIFIASLFLTACDLCVNDRNSKTNIANEKLRDLAVENHNKIISTLSKYESIKTYRYLVEDIKNDLKSMRNPEKLNVFDIVRIGERLEIAAKLGVFTPPDMHPADDPTGFFRGFNKCEEEEGVLKKDGTIEWTKPTVLGALTCKLNMIGVNIGMPRPY